MVFKEHSDRGLPVGNKKPLTGGKKVREGRDMLFLGMSKMCWFHSFLRSFLFFL